MYGLCWATQQSHKVVNELHIHCVNDMLFKYITIRLIVNELQINNQLISYDQKWDQVLHWMPINETIVWNIN
jgi:hypothetical protein